MNILFYSYEKVMIARMTYKEILNNPVVFSSLLDYSSYIKIVNGTKEELSKLKNCKDFELEYDGDCSGYYEEFFNGEGIAYWEKMDPDDANNFIFLDGNNTDFKICIYDDYYNLLGYFYKDCQDFRKQLCNAKYIHIKSNWEQLLNIMCIGWNINGINGNGFYELELDRGYNEWKRINDKNTIDNFKDVDDENDDEDEYDERVILMKKRMKINLK